MSGPYFAGALDYDGTLTLGDAPAPAVLAALAEARAGGLRLVLVTGRILAELAAVFPHAAECFDAIVAENGAVILRGGRLQCLASPVSGELARALTMRGVALRRGQVLLAMDACHARTVLEETARLGLEVEMIRNRDHLMVLPSGVTKASGLRHALADLGLSRHSTFAVADAENDHSLLDACELGVAVSNAIESLKAHADIVLREPAGDGVIEFLRGPIVRGEVTVEPRRWQVELGLDARGETVTLPGSGVNVAITGGSGTGKSRLLGLVAERLVGMEYSICLFDPEGDHVGLGSLPRVLALGGVSELPRPDQLAAILGHPGISVVVDLSLADQGQKQSYLRAALESVRARRRSSGLPHWILLDEAQVLGEDALEILDPSLPGTCIATYQPDLCTSVLRAADVLLDLELAGAVARVSLRRCGQGAATRFTMSDRATPHVRHWNKYMTAELPPQARFIWRAHGRPTGRIAGNVRDLYRELAECDLEAVRHHVASGDFSRWLSESVHDVVLAARVRGIERELPGGAAPVEVRRRLLQAIEARYLGPEAT